MCCSYQLGTGFRVIPTIQASARGGDNAQVSRKRSVLISQEGPDSCVTSCSVPSAGSHQAHREREFLLTLISQTCLGAVAQWALFP